METKKFKKSKKVTKLYNIDVIKILVPGEEPYGSKNSFKYFVGYNDDDVIRPLCIKHPQMIGYAKSFESNFRISLKISDKQLFKEYNQTLNIKSDSEPVYGSNDKYTKTKYFMVI